MAKKPPSEEAPPAPPLPRHKARPQAKPGLWRALGVWIRQGQLLGFLLALGSAAALAYIFLHPSFLVTEVTVDGNLVLPSEQARQVSQALGKNIFLLDTLAVTRRLTQVTYVQEALVERYLPSRVRLRIRERFPSVSWWTIDVPERYLVDNDGLVLGVELPEMSNLIYIMDLDKKPVLPGDHVDVEAVQTAQQVFSRLQSDLGLPLLAFEYQQGRGITAVSQNGWEALFGKSDHLEEKVRNLASLLQSGIPFEWVDLRLLDRVIYH